MAESTKCNRCSKQVIDNRDNAICCDSCSKWIHLKCPGLMKFQFKRIEGNSSISWYFKNCVQDIFPFANMDNRKFQNFIYSNSKMKEQYEEKLKTAISDSNFSNICSVCLRHVT